jgi:hypothetical protein
MMAAAVDGRRRRMYGQPIELIDSLGFGMFCRNFCGFFLDPPLFFFWKMEVLH